MMNTGRLLYDRADAERALREAGYGLPEHLAAREQALTASYLIRKHLSNAMRERGDTLSPNTFGFANTLWRLLRVVDLATAADYEGIIEGDDDPILYDSLRLLLAKGVLLPPEVPYFAEAMRALDLPGIADSIEGAANASGGGRVFDLLESRGAPDDMTIEAAITTGLVTQEEIDAAWKGEGPA